MPAKRARTELSLKWLDLFQICARKGSLQAAADDAGLSVSTISHHLRNLETHLGVALFDHSRRPMVLTPKGQVFLRGIDTALYAIRKAQAEATSGSVAEARSLRIGTIEDFDSDIVPDLAVSLSAMMPHCDFLYQTDVSHRVVERLHDRHLDLGIATRPNEPLRDLSERPLLQDPFMVVLPLSIDLADIVAGRTTLPFLRFSSELRIAHQIEAHLPRLGAPAPRRFECGNSQTLMAMVAAGAGWTISTPLLFSRAKRFQSKLRVHRFPGQSVFRTLSLFRTPDCAQSIFNLVDAKIRGLIRTHALEPFHRGTPWLQDEFRLV